MDLWPSLGEFAADYRTGTGEQRQVALSDRVTVEMNTQTRIDLVSARAGQPIRNGIDLLEGEAEVVAMGSAGGGTAAVNPVLVVAGRGRLQAEVARFNVRRTADRVCVTCVSGSIALDHPQRSLTLLPAQQVVYDDRHGPRVAAADPAAVVAWRRGLLMFNDVPLSQAIEEINRYRPGKLVLRNAALGQRRVQANLSIADIDRAVEMIQQVYGARVTKLPGNIVLLS
jgi:transmembrane sensor